MERQREGLDEESEQEQRQTQRRPRRPDEAGRLGDKDRQLMLVLNEARVLSQAQVSRLFYGGRNESVGRKRLKQLGDLGLVERHVLRRLDGPGDVCWSLTSQGEAMALRWGASAGTGGGPGEPDFLEHHLFFTELYVGLLAGEVEQRLARIPAALPFAERRRALGQAYARAQHPRWTWRAGGADTSLPWREYQGGARKERLIRPDALLEVPAARLRVFIEGETGSQPVRSGNKERFGATVAKLDRYLAYVSAYADAATRRTWYQVRFPDGFAAELLLLVPRGRRLTHVDEAVAMWRKANSSDARLSVRVLSLGEALQHYGALAQVPVPQRTATRPTVTVRPPSGCSTAPTRVRPALTSGDVRILAEYFESSRADLKRRQESVRRSQTLEPARRVSSPVIPARYEEMKALVARLTEGVRS